MATFFLSFFLLLAFPALWCASHYRESGAVRPRHEMDIMPTPFFSFFLLLAFPALWCASHAHRAHNAHVTTACFASFRTVTRPQWWMLRPAYYTPSICRAPLCYTLPPLRPCCVTTPQRWMIRPTCNTCWLLSSLFPFDLPIEDQPPQATWPCCGFGRSWCANVRRGRIHPSQRQSSAAFPLLSGPACAKLVPFTGMSLLPALLPCCDKATMVDATAHLLYTPSICRAPLCYTLPALRPCCDNATKVIDKAHLQYLMTSVIAFPLWLAHRRPTPSGLLPYCDKATMVDAKTRLLYPQYM